MRSGPLAVAALVLSCLACGCGASPREPEYLPVTRIDPEPPGEHCATGGQAVRSGLDQNRDGRLQEGEVTETRYLCSEPARALLVRTAPEPVGARCTQGGTVVLAGIDDDGDGALADGEVDQTTYLCSDAVLVRTSATAADATCPTGGARVESGRDRDGSGNLDAGEIEQSRTVCGPDVLVQADEVSTAEGCHGKGTRVRSGPDADGDGTLEDAEITDTSYVCSAEQYGYYVRDQADLDFLSSNVGVVSGALVIESSTLTNVHLAGVVVTGGIHVRDCSALQRLRLSPDMLGGDVVVERTPALTDLSLEINPTSYAIEALPILGDLSVTDAPVLKSIFLDNVPYIQGSLVLRRSGVEHLHAEDLLDSARGLVWIGGDLRIEDCDRFMGASMGRLTRIGGSFVLRGNAAVQRWDDGLRRGNRLMVVGDGTSGGDVVVEGNGAMTTVILDALTSVRGGIYVRGNPTLSSISHVALETIEDDYVVTDNAMMAAAGSFPIESASLSIEGAVLVERNPMLVTLGGLMSVRAIGSGVTIRDNASLRWIGMNTLPQLTSLVLERNASLEHLGRSTVPVPETDNLRALVSGGSFTIRGNGTLTRLQLPGLTQLSSLTVQDNAALPTCQAEVLASRTSPTTALISGNLDGGICP